MATVINKVNVAITVKFYIKTIYFLNKQKKYTYNTNKRYHQGNSAKYVNVVS